MLFWTQDEQVNSSENKIVKTVKSVEKDLCLIIAYKSAASIGRLSDIGQLWMLFVSAVRDPIAVLCYIPTGLACQCLAHWKKPTAFNSEVMVNVTYIAEPF